MCGNSNLSPGISGFKRIQRPQGVYLVLGPMLIRPHYQQRAREKGGGRGLMRGIEPIPGDRNGEIRSLKRYIKTSSMELV